MLLKLVSLLSFFFFNVAIRKFKIAYVAPIMCTRRAALDKKVNILQKL